MWSAVLPLSTLHETSTFLSAEILCEVIAFDRGSETTAEMELIFWLREYSQSVLRSRHGPQVGCASSHFTLRFLQLVQPSRDLL